MAKRKKPPTKKKASVTRGKTAAKKARQSRKANPRAEPWTIFVTYPPDPSAELELDPEDLMVNKRETVIYWMKAAGSGAITFILDPSTDKCPFGKLTLDAMSTKVTLHYHGAGDKKNRDWFYGARLTSTTGEVELYDDSVLRSGSTIKNH
jgi:hypothetical protein